MGGTSTEPANGTRHAGAGLAPRGRGARRPDRTAAAQGGVRAASRPPTPAGKSSIARHELGWATPRSGSAPPRVRPKQTASVDACSRPTEVEPWMRRASLLVVRSSNAFWSQPGIVATLGSVVAEPIHRDVKANGVRLRVVEAGEGPCIVLLHGLFVDGRIWSGVESALSASYRVVSPDLPGFGQSEKPPESRYPYGIQSFASAVVDLYAGLEFGRAALVGHGLGGAVAITLAARYPELISRLILVDSLCYPTKPAFVHRMATFPLVGGFAFKQLLGKTGFRAHFREAYPDTDAGRFGRRLDHYYDAFNTPAARASTLSTLRATRDTRAVVADIARVSVPTLVLWGRHDSLYPAAHGQRMAREIRQSGFRLLSTGHAPHAAEPEEVAAAIARFCAPPPKKA